MTCKPLFTEPGFGAGYSAGYDDGYKFGAGQIALFREYFECHKAMAASIKPDDFAKAAARANELRGILTVDMFEQGGE